MENGLDSSCLARFASLVKDRMGVRVPMGVIFTSSVERLYQYIRERYVNTTTTSTAPTAAVATTTAAMTEGKESEESTQEVVDWEAELQHYLSYLNLNTAPAILPHPTPPTALTCPTTTRTTVTTSTATEGSKKNLLLTGVTGHLGVFILRHLLSHPAVGEVYVIIRGSADRLSQALTANRLDASLAADKRVHVLVGKLRS